MRSELGRPRRAADDVLAYVARLEHRLDQAKAMNAVKGAMLADLLETEAGAGAAGSAETADAGAGSDIERVGTAEVREALAATEREMSSLRERTRVITCELERVDDEIAAARLRLARESHSARHGDPRVSELKSALRTAEGLEEHAHSTVVDATRRARAHRSARSSADGGEAVGGEQARVALERACTALRVGRMGCDKLCAMLAADVKRAAVVSAAPRDHRKRDTRPSRRAETEVQSGVVSLRREIALAAADVDASERWYGADASHHAQIAAEIDTLDRLAAERAGWLARLRLDGRELDEAIARAQSGGPEQTDASGGSLALLRALGTQHARGAPAAAPAEIGAHELLERKEALVRVRERSASVQTFLAEAERRTHEGEAALLVGLGRYAQAAREAHGACARVQALDELWAQSAHGRADLEARLSEAITDLLARAPADGQKAFRGRGSLRPAWASLAGEIEDHLGEARRALAGVREAP